MRTARIKAEDEGYYHCMSRIIERRQILDRPEKEKFRRIMRKLEAFCGLRVLTYTIISSHFHVLVHVPLRRELSDEELLERLAILYEPEMVEEVAARLADYRQHGQEKAAEALKAQYTYRMYDVSEFMKTLKQRFSQYYNRKTDRLGPLWAQRFKSVLVENSEHAILTMAVYIDLNAVRAGLASDPAEYRYCGYGEAMGGARQARDGLKAVWAGVTGETSWRTVRRRYRQYLFEEGRQRGTGKDGKPVRAGFSAERVQQVLDAGGRLPVHQILRCRVRYFSDGLVLGSREFVESVFQRYRGQFGLKRRTGARPMRYGQWDGLCTMRDLRSAVVFIPSG